MTEDNFENQSQPETAKYDVNANQRVTVETEDDEGRYVTTYVCAPFNEFLAEYDNQRQVLIEAKGKQQNVKSLSLKADTWLFDQIAIEPEGETDLPDNWKESVDDEEKQEVIARLLLIKVIETDSVKPLKKRTFARKTASNKTFKILTYFDGRELETSVTLAPKETKDLEEYESIRGAIGLHQGKGFDDSSAELPPMMAEKGKVFERMKRGAIGFEHGEIPLHVQAYAVTLHFDKAVRAIQKK